MRSIFFVFICVLSLITACSAQQQGKPAAPGQKRLAVQDVLGEWFGESKCTGKNPYCHDEIVRYRFSEIKDESGKVHLAADKRVNGEWDLMGEFDLAIDPAKSTLTNEFTVPRTGGKAVWSFTVTEDKIEGTLADEPAHVITRNVHVARQKDH